MMRKQGTLEQTGGYLLWRGQNHERIKRPSWRLQLRTTAYALGWVLCSLLIVEDWELERAFPLSYASPA